MVKHSQFVGSWFEWFEFVWPFCWVSAKGLIMWFIHTFISKKLSSRLILPQYIWVNVFKNKLSKICLGRSYHFRVFKGCLPQILLGPFLSTLTQLLEYHSIIRLVHTSLYKPWKHKKTRGFLMFAGGIERHHWHEMS